MNTPYVPDLHDALLKSVAPSLRQVPANAFGDSGSNANWREVDMFEGEALAFDRACAQLGIHAAWDVPYPGRSCRKLCKYEMTNLGETA